jgi:hypothetical protein
VGIHYLHGHVYGHDFIPNYDYEYGFLAGIDFICGTDMG